MSALREICILIVTCHEKPGLLVQKSKFLLLTDLDGKLSKNFFEKKLHLPFSQVFCFASVGQVSHSASELLSCCALNRRKFSFIFKIRMQYWNLKDDIQGYWVHLHHWETLFCGAQNETYLSKHVLVYWETWGKFLKNIEKLEKTLESCRKFTGNFCKTLNFSSKSSWTVHNFPINSLSFPSFQLFSSGWQFFVT